MRFRWRLTPLQFEHVWEYLGGQDVPLPLQVVSHGEDAEERLVLRRRVAEELRAAGLLRGERLDGELERAVRLLQHPQHWTQSVWMPDEHTDSPARVLAASSGSQAVLARQEPGPVEHAGGELAFAPVPAPAVPRAVIGQLPPAPPGRRSAVRLSADGVGPQPLSEEPPDGVLVDAGVRVSEEDRARRALADLVGGSHPAAGEITANARDRVGRVRRSRVLRWFDNPGDGRYLLTVGPGRDRTELITVLPATAADLEDQLRRLHAAVTTAAR